MGLVLFYLSLYVAIEADSPSLKMIVQIYESENGLTKEELINNFDGEKFLRSRLNYLVKDNLLAFDKKHYTLTSKGQNFLHICLYWRKILGMVNDVG
jgi:predicted transcriptional regulator